MKRAIGNNALRCVIVIACASCADALGLHDLVQRRAGGEPEGDGVASSDAGDNAALPSPIPVDADLVEENAAATSESTANADGSTPDGTSADADPETVSSEPDARAASGMADGAPVLEAGALEPEGGAGPSGPPAGPANACGCPGCVVHSNGVGDTFQDCVPSGTYNAMQALEACAAFTGSSADCMTESCPSGGGGPGPGTIPGQAVCGTRASVCDCWAFAGAETGVVQSSNGKCKPCGNGGPAWN
jgi:hypothetical protein